MKTITIQIGNSDDKLTQAGWSSFVAAVQQKVDLCCEDVHFSGGAPGWAEWQNYCWVVSVGYHNMAGLMVDIKSIRKMFNQDSIAWTEGDTIFV